MNPLINRLIRKIYSRCSFCNLVFVQHFISVIYAQHSAAPAARGEEMLAPPLPATRGHGRASPAPDVGCQPAARLTVCNSACTPFAFSSPSPQARRGARTSTAAQRHRKFFTHKCPTAQRCTWGKRGCAPEIVSVWPRSRPLMFSKVKG